MKNRFIRPILSVFYISTCIFISSEVHAECGQGRGFTSKLEAEDFAALDYQELLNFDLRVTSPSKKPQKFSEVSSALSVLTQEDIRRSAARHIGDVLRLIPGLNVAQINNSQWAISSRGFNQRFSNKLLVLVDGQVVFTPAFNGVFWEQLGLSLHDIDRIEVIRGPGAALWGSNAVNGVINIITCSSAETQGGLASISGGKEERFSGNVRYGAKLSEQTSYRAYVNHRNLDENILDGGGGANDELNMTSGGVRLDSKVNQKDSLTFKAEGFYHDADNFVAAPSLTPPFVDLDTYSGDRQQYGVNLLSLWQHSFSETSDAQLQFDYIFESQEGTVFPLDRHTFHADAQHRFIPFDDHEIVYGIESRFYFDELQGTFADDFIPQNRSTDLYTLFINDEITLIHDRLKLILGTKLEKNSHTGYEFMPNVRTVFTPNTRHTFWAAISRAIADPSRAFEDVVTPLAAFPDEETGLPVLLTLFGDRNVDSEELTAYEAGYRTQLTDKVFFDFTAFYNSYDKITSAEPGEAFFGSLKDQPSPSIIFPVSFANGLEVESFGFEVQVDYSPYEWWRLVASYAFIDLHVSKGESADLFDEKTFIEGLTPHNTAVLRSSFDLSKAVEFDTIFRYTDSLSASEIDDYLELDLRVGWKVNNRLSFSLIGKNLLDSSHNEFFGQLLNPPQTRIQRAILGEVTWVF